MCPVCKAPVVGRKTFCSEKCRQRAWFDKHVSIAVAKMAVATTREDVRKLILRGVLAVLDEWRVPSKAQEWADKSMAEKLELMFQMPGKLVQLPSGQVKLREDL